MEAVPGQTEDAAATSEAVTEQPGSTSSGNRPGFEAGGIDELEKTSKIIVQQVCMPGSPLVRCAPSLASESTGLSVSTDCTEPRG